MSGSASATGRRPGRPSKRPPLNERIIAEAALEIIDAKGWQSCTMQALAERLGVRAPSLYHHVAGQRGIIDIVRELIVREIHDPSIRELPWDEAMLRFGIAYYRAFANHPNTIQVLSVSAVRDAATLQMYETFLVTLRDAGWSGERAFEALLGLEHLALGFAFEWNADDMMLDAEICTASGAPLLAEIVAAQTDGQAAAAETAFLNLLRRYIDMHRRE